MADSEYVSSFLPITEVYTVHWTVKRVLTIDDGQQNAAEAAGTFPFAS